MAERLDLGPIKKRAWKVGPSSPDAEVYAVACDAPSLVREVERYRSLLERLTATTTGAPLCPISCEWCGGYVDCDTLPHEPGCPWPEVLAEVEATTGGTDE